MEAHVWLWSILITFCFALGCMAIVDDPGEQLDGEPTDDHDSGQTDSDAPIDTSPVPVQDTDPQAQTKTTAVSITSGGSEMESTSYRARLFIGGPPVGEAQGTDFNATLGIGAVVEHQE